MLEAAYDVAEDADDDRQDEAPNDDIDDIVLGLVGDQGCLEHALPPFLALLGMAEGTAVEEFNLESATEFRNNHPQDAHYNGKDHSPNRYIHQFVLGLLGYHMIRRFEMIDNYCASAGISENAFPIIRCMKFIEPSRINGMRSIMNIGHGRMQNPRSRFVSIPLDGCMGRVIYREREGESGLEGNVRRCIRRGDCGRGNANRRFRRIGHEEEGAHGE